MLWLQAMLIAHLMLTLFSIESKTGTKGVLPQPVVLECGENYELVWTLQLRTCYAERFSSPPLLLALLQDLKTPCQREIALLARLTACSAHHVDAGRPLMEVNDVNELI